MLAICRNPIAKPVNPLLATADRQFVPLSDVCFWCLSYSYLVPWVTRLETFGQAIPDYSRSKPLTCPKSNIAQLKRVLLDSTRKASDTCWGCIQATAACQVLACFSTETVCSHPLSNCASVHSHEAHGSRLPQMVLVTWKAVSSSIAGSLKPS